MIDLAVKVKGEYADDEFPCAVCLCPVPVPSSWPVVKALCPECAGLLGKDEDGEPVNLVRCGAAGHPRGTCPAKRH